MSQISSILLPLMNVLRYCRYDRNAAETMLRRCLEIRENHFDKDDLRVADVLFQLGTKMYTLMRITGFNYDMVRTGLEKPLNLMSVLKNP